MNYLAPRQGVFAIILLVSFCLHLLIVMISMERQQYDYRIAKGEKIVEQLSKETQVAVANQDRISLGVLANRYQVDDDVAQLIISDANQQNLIQVGISQNEMGKVIEQPIIQNNTQIGTIRVTMKALAKGEVLSGHWIFMLGSLVLHIFLWLLYRLVAMPTKMQLEAIGEKLQERLIISRTGLLKSLQTAHTSDVANTDIEPKPQTKTETKAEKSDNSEKTGQNIQSYLQKNRNQSPDIPPTTILKNTHQPILQNPNRATLPTENTSNAYEVAVQIRFFDEFNLLARLSPEVAQPYLHLCQQLLLRACDRLFIAHESISVFGIEQVSLKQLPYFDQHGAVIQLTGQDEDVVLASILLAKLMLILNQVVYEKHRELSRFALPMTAGVSMDLQKEDMNNLMKNHAKEDGLLILYPKNLLKCLEKNVQFKHTNQPMNISEREMVSYNGLSQVLMKALIAKRDDILTSTER